MSEFLNHRAPKLLLISALGLAGCSGEAVNNRVFPGLDCGGKSDKTMTIEFPGMVPGDIIMIGHPRSDKHGITSDATVSLTAEGNATATSNDRGDISNPSEVQTEGAPGGGVKVTAGDEVFTVKVEAETTANRFATVVTGQCVQPA